MFLEELYRAGMVIGDQFLENLENLENLFLEDSGNHSGADEELEPFAVDEEDEDQAGGYEIVTWESDEGISDTEYEDLDIVTRYTGWVTIEEEEDWDAIPEVYHVTKNITIVHNETTDEMWFEYEVL